MNDKTIRDLINELNYYTFYYDKGESKISDEEWDELYFQLKKREEMDGIIYPDSPTQTIHFEKVSELNKIKHLVPMLSLDKTKEISDIESFVKGHNWCGMFKCDGLSCALTYDSNGKLISAETRGNGIEGEDITHNAKIIKNIPQAIPINKRITIHGEIVCLYKDFKPFANDYANPRNFAAGSLRLLDAKETASRNLSFIAWDVIGLEDIDFFFWRLEKLDKWGFITVPRIGDAETINDAIQILDDMKNGKGAYVNSWYQECPIDGYVFRFMSQEYFNSLGSTEHHRRGALAYKFYNEEYETTLVDIEYTMGRLGILTPVAIFEPIQFPDSVVTRASLHNLSIMKETLGNKPFIGQKLWITKSNDIIPYVNRAEKNNDI